MRDGYIIYPAAHQKLLKSGIKEKVEILKNSDDGLPYCRGHAYPDEIRDAYYYLKKKEYYERIPEDFAGEYKKIINGIFNKPENYHWEVQKYNNLQREPCMLEDMRVFLPDLASLVLQPYEVWEYKAHGFSSPSEFIITVGAYVHEEAMNRSHYDRGYSWITQRPDGSDIGTHITGDGNCDLRVFQNDVTHYPTKDPFGNPVHLRPIPDETQNAVAAYHSTEGSMLVTVLKYIQQMNIPTSFEKDNGAAIINWGRSFRQGGGTCAEHFGGFDQDPRFYLHNMFYNIDLPQLSKHDQVEQPSAYSVSTASRGHYSAYISANRDLVFSYEDETKPLKQKKRINIRFLPQDAEHAVKGLIYQAAHGLGRTSAKQLLDIIEYRYSPAFRAMQV